MVSAHRKQKYHKHSRMYTQVKTHLVRKSRKQVQESKKKTGIERDRQRDDSKGKKKAPSLLGLLFFPFLLG